MRRGHTAALAAWTLLAAAPVVLSGPSASALPGNCDRTWAHDNATVQNWETPGDWNPNGIPGSTPNEVICASTTDTLAIDASGARLFNVDEVQLEGNTKLDIQQGAGLFVDGSTESVWTSTTATGVTMAELGGAGTIRAQGNMTFTSGQFGTFLTTVHNGGGTTPPADPGELVVEGKATLANLGLALSAGYQVDVANGGTVALAPNAWFAADYGTATTIDVGGTLDFTGDGAYYQGFHVTGQGLSVLTNNGTIVKSGGTGTSVVDADYVQGATGQVVVKSGTLALPDDHLVAALVSPGTSLATGTCGSATPSAVCQPTTDPTQDAMSVDFTVPAANGTPATVQLQELGPVGTAVDPNGIGNEVLAHADNLVASPATPAVLELRMSQADVMATPTGEVQVVHSPDAGPAAQIPLCVAGAIPSGAPACLLSVTRDAQNTFIKVLTTQTSRWRVRKGPAVEPPKPPPGVPAAPQEVTVDKAPPFDGSAYEVSWSAPAANGGASVTSYRVSLDGKQVPTSSATSALLKSPGPGKHSVSVAAVNSAGTGPAATVSVSVADISKPRKVKDVRGAPSGKLTAGVSWKPPANAGGFAITGYKIAVFKADGTKVDTVVVKASKRKYLLKLKPGRYFLKVRARNSDRWGPWSKPTDLVRPR